MCGQWDAGSQISSCSFAEEKLPCKKYCKNGQQSFCVAGPELRQHLSCDLDNLCLFVMAGATLLITKLIMLR